MTTKNECGKIPCHYCKGTGLLNCDCRDHWLKTVVGHPLNQLDFDDNYSRQGYVVRVCSQCGKVFGIRYQWDAGTGSDNHIKDFGFGDPFELVKERHY